jgi:hypothetical protein
VGARAAGARRSRCLAALILPLHPGDDVRLSVGRGPYLAARSLSRGSARLWPFFGISEYSQWLSRTALNLLSL